MNNIYYENKCIINLDYVYNIKCVDSDFNGDKPSSFRIQFDFSDDYEFWDFYDDKEIRDKIFKKIRDKFTNTL